MTCPGFDQVNATSRRSYFNIIFTEFIFTSEKPLKAIIQSIVNFCFPPQKPVN